IVARELFPETHFWQCHYHALMASQNIPTPIDSLQWALSGILDLMSFLCPYGPGHYIIILDSCGQCLEETHFWQCHYHALMASQNIPTPIDSLQWALSGILDLMSFLCPYGPGHYIIILDSCGQCLEGLITVVIPLDRSLQGNSFQKLIFVNALIASQNIPTPIDSLQWALSGILDLMSFLCPYGPGHYIIILDSCGQCLEETHFWQCHYHALMASQNIPTPIDSLQWALFGILDLMSFLCPYGPGHYIIIMDSCGQCLEDGYFKQDSSYFSNTEIETWGYMGCLEYLAKNNLFDKLTNATESLANATENLMNAKENLYELKLKSRAYDRYIEIDKDDRSSKRFRQETSSLMELLPKEITSLY
ncbi:3468_t:CDS:10, partial [Gigaspora margarita]